MQVPKHYIYPALFGFGVLLSFLVFWPGLKGPFLLDDVTNLPLDPSALRSLPSILEMVMGNESGPLGRPIAMFSFGLNTLLWGATPFGFKFINLLIHLLNAFLVWQLLIKLTKHRGLAITTTVLWMTHPLLHSTILYSVQRMSLLSAFFMLCALNAYAYWRPRCCAQPTYWPFLLLSTFSFALLAIFSKENAFVLPLLLLLIERLYFRDDTRSSRLFTLGLLVYTFCMVAVAVLQWPHWLELYEIRGWTPAERLLTQVHALGHYIQLTLWPTPEALSLYHDDFMLIDQIYWETMGWISLFAFSIFLAFRFRRRAPEIAFAVGWFFICHSIESSIVPLELFFEHRNYLASVGLVLLVASFFSILGPMLTISLPILLFSHFCLMSYERSVFWSDLTIFTEHTLMHRPNSFRAHVDAARVSYGKGAWEIADHHLHQAQSLVPSNPGPTLHAVYFACQQGQVPEPLITETVGALRRGRDFSYAVQAFTLLSVSLSQHPCDGLSRVHLISLMQHAIDSTYLAYRPEQLSHLFYLQAMNFAMESNFREARRRLEKSIDANPKNPLPLLEKANLYLYQKDKAGFEKTAERLMHYSKWRYPVLHRRLSAMRLEASHLPTAQD